MTLDERLQVVFPDGAPADVVAFLRGGWVSDAQAINSNIQARAEAVFKQNTQWQIKIGFLTHGLERRRDELAATEAELSIDRLCASSAEYLIEKVTKRNALAWAVERIEAERTRVESEATILTEHWKTLSELAMARIKKETLSGDLAEMFAPQKAIEFAGAWGLWKRVSERIRK